jgi:hypothetical protein
VDENRWILESQILTATEGIGLSGTIDIFLGQLLTILNGKQKLQESIGLICNQMAASYDEIVGPCLQAVRGLLRAGFLRIVS